jgi:hypothetical protein
MPHNFLDFKKQRSRWAFGAMQILRHHFGLLFRGRGTHVTAGQRYHFIAGWLPWLADGFNLVFNCAPVPDARGREPAADDRRRHRGAVALAHHRLRDGRRSGAARSAVLPHAEARAPSRAQASAGRGARGSDADGRAVVRRLGGEPDTDFRRRSAGAGSAKPATQPCQNRTESPRKASPWKNVLPEDLTRQLRSPLPVQKIAVSASRKVT